MSQTNHGISADLTEFKEKGFAVMYTHQHYSYFLELDHLRYTLSVRISSQI